MFVFNSLIAALAFVGRHGTIAVASSIVAGLAIPPLAAAFKPWLGEAIFFMLTLAFLRVEPSELQALARRPALIASTVVWVMLALPAILASLFLLSGFDKSMPGLYVMLVLQASAPSLMSSPALAALMGLDVALTLAALVLSAAVVPLTASLFSHIFIGTSYVTPIDLGIKLFMLIATAAAVAALIRRVAGPARLAANIQVMDGMSVLGMFVFAAAAMDGVIAHTFADPKLTAALLALTFALALGTMAVTTLVFLPAGRTRAFAVGILAGNRNIGLMLAATGFAVPDIAWLYFGLAQFPIYLLPLLLKPVARRLEQSGKSASLR